MSACHPNRIHKKKRKSGDAFVVQLELDSEIMHYITRAAEMTSTKEEPQCACTVIDGCLSEGFKLLTQDIANSLEDGTDKSRH